MLNLTIKKPKFMDDWSFVFSKGDVSSAQHMYARINWRQGQRIWYVLMARRSLTRCFNLPVWVVNDKPVLFERSLSADNVNRYIILFLMVYVYKGVNSGVH